MAIYLGSKKVNLAIAKNFFVGDEYRIVRTGVAEFYDDGSVDLSEFLGNANNIKYIIGITDDFSYVAHYDVEGGQLGHLNSSGAVEVGGSWYTGDGYWYFDPELFHTHQGDNLYLIGLGSAT